MGAVRAVEAVMAWLEDRVCPLVELKEPPDRGRDDESYPFRTVHPAVLGMYWPPGRQMAAPAQRGPHPGALVQLVEGSETAAPRKASMRFRIHLSAWNPGPHGPDAWEPRPEGGFERSSERSFAPGYADGWRDAWNFLDTVRRELRHADSIGGALSIDRSQPVAFGPYEEQGAIIDLYPYFFAWVEFAAVEAAASPAWAEDFL